MTIQEIMKKDVECCSPDDSVQSAAERMRQEGVGFLPVCLEDGSVAGTITDRDIAIRLVADAKPYDTKISQVMTREIVACPPTESLRKAEQLMAQRHKSRLLVCEGKRLVGVLSLSDIATQEDEAERVVQTMREVSEREVRA